MRERLLGATASIVRSRTTTGSRTSPDDPDLAIAAGTRLCEELLEPLHATFGHVTVRSAFRSVEVNTYGNECNREQGTHAGETTWNHSRHVWDRRDAEGCMGATASIVIPWFIPRSTTRERPGRRSPGGSNSHDHLP